MNEIFKALSHPVRRKIVAMLRDRPMASGEIAEAFDMAWPTVTGHLTALKDAGLVETEKTGVSVRYRLNITAAQEAVAFLMDLMGSGDETPAPQARPEVRKVSKGAKP
jgi:DNA-binding transcriptional ArsR family regulator